MRQWSDTVMVLGSALGPLGATTRHRLASRSIEVVQHDVVEISGATGALKVQLANGELVELDALFTGGLPEPHDDFLSSVGLPTAARD